MSTLSSLASYPPPTLPTTDDPRVAILQDEAALCALKRVQLVSLCKTWGIKAVGKNTDLASKLFAHGQHLRSQPASASIIPSHPTSDPTDGADWSLVSASAVAAAMEVDEPTEFGLAVLEGTLKSKSSSLGKRLGGAFRSHTVNSSTTLSSQTTVQSISTLPGTFRQPPDEPEGENDDGIRMVSSSPAKDSRVSSPAKQSPFPRASWLPHAASPQPSPPRPIKASPSRLALPASRPSFVFGSPTTETPAFQFGDSLFPTALAQASTITNAGLTPAQLIIKEMNDRVAAQRPGASFGTDGLASSSTLFALSSVKGKEKEKLGAFDGKHKRVFDKMDSISTHYAAKRPVNATSTSDASAKRLKLASPEKKMVAALREDGWLAPSPAKAAFGSSAGSVRSDLKPDEDQVARKRALERAKARRTNGLAPLPTPGKGRRKSLVIGRQPKSTGNAASRFVKATFKKLTNAPPVPPLPSGSTTSRTFRPTTSSSSTLPKTGSVAKKEPGWKKFDLQASLARPLGYVPRKGPVPGALPPTPSTTLSRATSFSRLPRSTTLGSLGPAHTSANVPSPWVHSSSSTAHASADKPSPWAHPTVPASSRQRTMSSRVANSDLLQQVKKPILEEVVGELVEKPAPDENNDVFSSDPIQSLPAPLFTFSTTPSTWTPRTTLGSPFRPVNSTSGPFRPAIKSSPAKLSAGRKVVSSATRAARETKPRATKVEGLESRARAVAKKGGAARKVV